MPLALTPSYPSLAIRRRAFESSGLTRQAFDDYLGLTDAEFRVEGDLVVIGPVLATEDLPKVIDALEDRGLVYFDDYFELSGNWPEWLGVFVQGE